MSRKLSAAPEKTGVNVEILDIEQIQFDPHNPREHDAKNLNTIEKSIEAFGTGRSILIDENGQLIAGEGTTKSAVARGIKKVVVVDNPGDVLIAVRRRNLTDIEKRELAIVDNRSNETSNWNYEKLQETLKLAQEEGRDLTQLGWSLEELTPLLEAEFSIGDDGAAVSGDGSFAPVFDKISLEFVGENAKIVKEFDEKFAGENLILKIVGLCRKALDLADVMDYKAESETKAGENPDEEK